MCHIMEFSCSGSSPNHPVSLENSLSFFKGGGLIHLATIPVLGGGNHRLFLMEFVVNFPILSPSFHFSLSSPQMTTSFYGFTRTEGFPLTSGFFLTLLQSKLSRPCLINYYSSICILSSRNLWKLFVYSLLFSSLPVHLMLF